MTWFLFVIAVTAVTVAVRLYRENCRLTDFVSNNEWEGGYYKKLYETALDREAEKETARKKAEEDLKEFKARVSRIVSEVRDGEIP